MERLERDRTRLQNKVQVLTKEVTVLSVSKVTNAMEDNSSETSNLKKKIIDKDKEILDLSIKIEELEEKLSQQESAEKTSEISKNTSSVDAEHLLKLEQKTKDLMVIYFMITAKRRVGLN